MKDGGLMGSANAPLWRLSASELNAAYRAGAATPEQATQACLERLDAVNPALNAVVTIDRDGASNAARASSERWRRGVARGGLDGVPITVKDNLFVAGLRATWGSLLFADHVAPTDDLSVGKLRAAGAIILGKTNTPELALAGHTDNRVFGATGNPWDPDLSPGGSSGGAAAAVMAGIAPLAVVTDAAGSTRRPASHVGCVGLKASLGRIPRREGFPPLASDLQSIGCLARTIKDARTLFECIAVPATGSPRRAERLRIGAFCRIGSAPVEPAIEMVWRQACVTIAQQGHEIVPLDAPYDPDAMSELFTILASVGVARVVAEFPGWREAVMPQIARLAEKGAAIPATDYVNALDQVARFRWAMADRFASVDLLLTPTVAGPLWPKADPFPKSIAGREAAPRASAIYTTFVNLAGLAGLSIPAGCFANGHPIGIQLVGPLGSEELMLDLATRWEELRPWRLLAPE